MKAEDGLATTWRVRGRVNLRQPKEKVMRMEKMLMTRVMKTREAKGEVVALDPLGYQWNL